MAFDQGTTSSRCILYNRQGRAISVAQKEITQIYPENGWVEHDPMEIWSIQVGLAQEAMYKVNCTYENIAAIGITNQRGNHSGLEQNYRETNKIGRAHV